MSTSMNALRPALSRAPRSPRRFSGEVRERTSLPKQLARFAILKALPQIRRSGKIGPRQRSAPGTDRPSVFGSTPSMLVGVAIFDIPGREPPPTAVFCGADFRESPAGGLPPPWNMLPPVFAMKACPLHQRISIPGDCHSFGAAVKPHVSVWYLGTARHVHGCHGRG